MFFGFLTGLLIIYRVLNPFMNCWLAISNRENADIVIKKNIWGVSRRFVNQISKVIPGDRLLVYTRNQVIDKDTSVPAAIVAAFQVISKVYEDDSKIFHPLPTQPNETFPLRIKLKTEKIFEPGIEFKQLVPQLQFITNKKQWSGHIRGQAMRTIPEEDYELIMNQTSR
jgi:predicted RNA-binding protein